jgi:hypothetical protein
MDPWRLVHEWGVAMSGYFSWTFFSIIFLRSLLGSIAGHRPEARVVGFFGHAMAYHAISTSSCAWAAGTRGCSRSRPSGTGRSSTVPHDHMAAGQPGGMTRIGVDGH